MPRATDPSLPARLLGYALCLAGAWLGMPGGLARLPGAAVLFPAGIAILVMRAPSARRAMADAFLAGALAWTPPLFWVRTPALISGGPGADIAWLWPVVIGTGKGMYLAILAGFARLAASRAGPLLAGAYAGTAWFLMEHFKAAWCKCPLPQFVAGLSEWPWMVQACSLAGAYGLAGLLAACAFWLAAPAGGKAPRLLALAVMAGLGAHSAASLNGMPREEGTVRLALVQGNTPLVFKWEPEVTYRLLDRYAELTRQAMASGNAGAAVWPETSLPTYFLDGIPSTAKIRALARELRAPMLMGVFVPEPDGSGVAQYNRAVLLGPDGATLGQTEKVRLVPFGEYIPAYFTFIPQIVSNTGLTRPGRARAVLDSGTARYGVAICFESMFPAAASELVDKGANILVNLSNDAWFKGSAGSGAHLAHARLRAVEQGRYMARCTNTGITCLLDPRGRMVARAAENEALVLDPGPAGLIAQTTVYQRSRVFVERAALWGFLGLTAWFALDWLQARTRGRRGGGAP